MINTLKFIYELLLIKIENKLTERSNKNKRYSLNIYENIIDNEIKYITITIEVNCVVLICESVIEDKNNFKTLKLDLLIEVINKLRIKLDNNDLNKINILKRQCALI